MLMRLTCVFVLLSATTPDAMPVRWSASETQVPPASQPQNAAAETRAASWKHSTAKTNPVVTPLFENIGLLGHQTASDLATEGALSVSDETYKDLLPVR